MKKSNNKKYLIALALLPVIAACGAAAWLVIRDTPRLIESTRANYSLWTLMQSEDVTVEEIAENPLIDSLTDDDLLDLIDEARINKRLDISEALIKKLRDRKIRG